MTAEANGARVVHMFSLPMDAARLFLRARKLDGKRETMPLARELYRECVRIAPKHAEAWNNLGVLASNLGDKSGALEAWGTAIECDVGRPEAYNNIGCLLQSEGKLQVASTYLAKAVKLDADMAEARVNLALCLQGLGRRRAALRQWQAYLERWPEGDFAHVARKHAALCAG